MWSDLTARPFPSELPSKPVFLPHSSLSPVLAISVPLEAPLGHPSAGEQSPLSYLTRGQQQQRQGKQPSSSQPAKLFLTKHTIYISYTVQFEQATKEL